MIVIIGLGNLGSQYENTPHNAGFVAVDIMAAQYNFPAFQESLKYTSLVTEGMINNTKILLAKPQTMMNNSGVAVASLAKQLTDPNSQLIIVHDEVDLPLGTIRLAKDSGSAGHKGIQSIISSLGSKGFCRIRIGIHPPEGKDKDTDSYVLKKLSVEQQELLKETIISNLSLIEECIKE